MRTLLELVMGWTFFTQKMFLLTYLVFFFLHVAAIAAAGSVLQEL